MSRLCIRIFLDSSSNRMIDELRLDFSLVDFL
jgi:hypothetical protein